MAWLRGWPWPNRFPTASRTQIIPAKSAPDKEATVAKPTSLPWCTGKYTLDSWPIPKFKEALRERGHDSRLPAWVSAAEHLCEHKEDPTWVRQATNLVQEWMNLDNDTQADVEKQIAEEIVKAKQARTPEGQVDAEASHFRFDPAMLNVHKPDAGVDQATITTKPAWCDQAGKFAIDDRWDSGRISRTVGGKYGIQGTVEGALHICQRPTDKTWKVEAGYILQKWMNWTHLSQPDAERSLRARIQIDKFKAERDELCKALVVNPEVGGEAKTYGEAQRDLFGCKNDSQTLWQDASPMNTAGVGFYLDSSIQPDELMRMYWLFGYVRNPFEKELPAKDAGDNIPLLYYAVAQNDFVHLDQAAIDKTLSAAPYNDYARIVVLETLGALKGEQKAYEQAVDKMAKGDEDYTAILRTAPNKAFARWDKAVAQWKPEIERSNAFEKRLSEPSRKAIKGCSAELKKDGEKLVKSFKTNVYKDLLNKLAADPVANLLLSRIALCYAAENVFGASGAIKDLVSHGREMRGPRSLAYYAIVDAIAEARKDRPRLLLDFSGFYASGGLLSSSTNIDSSGFNFNGHAPEESEKDTLGVVASTKNVADGVEIVFKKVTLTYPDYECTDDTRHPLKIKL